jgi:hypothetical protein
MLRTIKLLLGLENESVDHLSFKIRLDFFQKVLALVKFSIVNSIFLGTNLRDVVEPLMPGTGL